MSSPELVLVLSEAERRAAIQALPPPPIWNPEPLLPVVPAAADAGTQRLAATALVYFAAKLVWTVATAAVYAAVIVAVVTMLTLIF
jgi:hypothetical protein